MEDVELIRPYDLLDLLPCLPLVVLVLAAENSTRFLVDVEEEVGTRRGPLVAGNVHQPVWEDGVGVYGHVTAGQWGLKVVAG